ncbi:HTTM domain-containing protein [Halobacteria archaeon AArc-dxtr1]|nr:HTTM domain-containing protein [Halobacteria archaeon AArc-dxtr1]
MADTRSGLDRAADRSPSVSERLHTALVPRLGVDLRALAAFRIALGAIVLADLVFLRLPGLVTFYTDAGIFPRSTLAETYPTFATFSIHALSGAAWVQGVLFAVTGFAALSLLVGYRTRLATGLSALLLASLFARNPLVLNGGDTILLSLLAIGLFLPLGARWSLDARRYSIHGPSRPDSARGNDHVFSLATAVLLSHLVVIYTINALLKYRSDPWMAGTAVQRIFHVDEFVVLFGPSLADNAVLLAATNWLWTVLLTLAPFLIVYTGRLRIALVAAFIASHLGMAATMRLGAFPFVMVAALLAFLPPQIWDRMDPLAERVAAWLDRRPLLDRVGQRAGPDVLWTRTAVSMRRTIRIGSAVLLICGFTALVAWQAAGAGLVDAPAGSDGELSDGSWAFFAPNPPDTSSWYVVEATLESGETIDAADGGAVTFDRPPDVAATYPTTLWHRHGSEIRYADDTHYEPTAAYVCENVADDLESVTIYYVEQSVGPNGPGGDPVLDERITRTC